MNLRRFVLIALAAAALGVCTQSASAQTNWSGLYIGANIGGLWAKDSATTAANPVGWFGGGAAVIDGATGGSVTPNGVSGGLQAGQNWQAPG